MIIHICSCSMKVINHLHNDKYIYINVLSYLYENVTSMMSIKMLNLKITIRTNIACIKHIFILYSIT